MSKDKQHPACKKCGEPCKFWSKDWGKYLCEKCDSVMETVSVQDLTDKGLCYVCGNKRPLDGSGACKQCATPPSILLEADKLVNGERQEQYDDPIKNFEKIALLATAMTGKQISPTDCCKVLMAVKLAREQYKHKRDNLIDLVGYTEILNRIHEAYGG